MKLYSEYSYPSNIFWNRQFFRGTKLDKRKYMFVLLFYLRASFVLISILFWLFLSTKSLRLEEFVDKSLFLVWSWCIINPFVFTFSATTGIFVLTNGYNLINENTSFVMGCEFVYRFLYAIVFCFCGSKPRYWMIISSLACGFISAILAIIIISLK